MRLVVTRKEFGPDYTIGELSIDGGFHCFTLEDKVREIENCPVDRWKIPGQTAIPIGTYDLTINFSQRFKRLMPLLVGVPGFDGVRIHSGNTDKDTEGCILVGWERVGSDFIGKSRDAFDALFPLLSDAVEKEHVYVSIVNDPPPSITVAA